MYAAYNSINGYIELITNETIDCPYTNNWVFFVDDKPWAGWFHDCRYIFVSTETGDFSIVNSTIFPKDQLSGYELISEESGYGTTYLGEATGDTPDPVAPNDHYYAVIICVLDYQEGWNDLSLVYNTLINIYGYKKENIFVHYGQDGTSGTPNEGDLDNDGSNDLDYSAFSMEIHATFNELAGNTTLNDDIPILKEDDQLAFFVVDAPTSFVGPGTTVWFFWADWGGTPQLDMENPEDLAATIDQIDCAQMTMVFSINYAEGLANRFIDYGGLADCKSRYVHACTFEEEKHEEKYITAGGGVFSGEYLFYWCAAVRGFYPDENIPWEPGIETGEFPFTSVPGLGNHPGDIDPDSNGDGFVQMEEAFYYANAMDTWSDDGYYYNPIEPGEEIPMDYDGVPFIEDVLTMAGYAGHLETPVSVEGSFVIGGTLYFEHCNLGQKFEFEDNSKIFLVNPQSNIIIQETSKVQLGQYTEVAGACIANELKVLGKLSLSFDNQHFYGLDGNQWKGIVYDNIDNTTVTNFINCTFENCLVRGTTYDILFNQSIFSNSGAYISAHYISFHTCDFNHSNVDLSGAGIEPLTETVYMFDTDFYGQDISKPAVSINSFENFELDDVYASNHTHGIRIFNSGTGIYSKIIRDCYIHNCSGPGITVYHTDGTLFSNSSNNNSHGVMFFDRCNIEFVGNDQADYCGLTQNIKDNESYEVYVSRSSFPHTFRWNCIRDEDNTVPLVYVRGVEGPFDVRNNAWGVYFDPTKDFYPWLAFIYEPVWTLIYDDTETEEAETLYNTSMAAESDGNFSFAQSGYYQIISEYPESQYTDAAMKRLYSIESYVNNDYSGLKAFYNTEPNITNDPELNKLADFLVNFCEGKLENWPTAIAWFENVIQNPESIEDSIFAIIDLGYTYFLMEQSGYKSSYSGTMIEHIPQSVDQFKDKRDYLLSLLPGDQLSETMKENINQLKTGELLQNVPNPFNGSTQIWYKLEDESIVKLHIYDYTGKQIRPFNEGSMAKGSHFVEFNAEGLPAGIYFYSLEINGIVTDSKKMTILR